MPARAYATDWVLLILNIGIFAIAPFVIYLYLPFFKRLNITTAYEYLEKRFHVSIRLLGSLSFMAFQLGRMGIVVLLPALALSAVTGLNVHLCIVLMGILSTVYTVLGGIGAITCFSVACLSSMIIPTKVERLTGLNIYNVPKPTH